MDAPWPADRTLQTRASIAEGLRRLGVPAGGCLLVHASLSSLGYVLGGATAVVAAVLDTVGPDGTIVVPSQTPENRDPSRWTEPPVPEEWWPRIRADLPAFDPVLTPSSGMGAVAERVRTWPGADRSAHPQTSFAAVGPRAAELLAGHALTAPLGEESPLARLERASAGILLLGVGYDRCTAFHLAEYRLADPPLAESGCAVLAEGGRQWVTYRSVALDQSDFVALGAAYEAAGGPVRTGRVGDATARYLPLREAVRFAHGWMSTNRTPGQALPTSPWLGRTS
jgi:aminoglycoside 3-N-acetyltransferase